MNKPDGLQAFEQPLASLPCTLRQLILEQYPEPDPLRAGDWNHMGKSGFQVNPLSATRTFSGRGCR